MEEYYSFEQLVCAGIACLNTSLSAEYIVHLQAELEKTFPEMVMVNDIIRCTRDYINYTPGFYEINEHFSLDSIGIYENETMSLKEYLKIVAGPKLVSFMQTQKIRNYMDEAFGGR